MHPGRRYDPTGNRLAEDRDGHQTDSAYDDSGRLVSAADGEVPRPGWPVVTRDAGDWPEPSGGSTVREGLAWRRTMALVLPTEGPAYNLYFPDSAAGPWPDRLYQSAACRCPEATWLPNDLASPRAGRSRQGRAHARRLARPLGSAARTDGAEATSAGQVRTAHPDYSPQASDRRGYNARHGNLRPHPCDPSPVSP
jgi:YD repeat-containing protein